MVDVSLMCIHFSNFQFSANWYVENIRAELTKETCVEVSRGYTDYYQGRGHSIRLTATVINIHEHLI